MNAATAPQDHGQRRGNRRVGIGLAVFALVMFLSFIARQWANGA